MTKKAGAANGGDKKSLGAGHREVDWKSLIQAAVGTRLEHVLAETYLKKWGSASKPVALSCADGNIYVVKGQQAGRMVFNDQVAARFGSLIGAPVPPVALVLVPDDLIKASAQMGHVQAGLSHGSREIGNTTDKSTNFDHLDDGDNKARFLALAIFYGWMHVGDRQFIFEKSDPHLVHSVDHGHFFHGGPNWTTQSLAQAPSAVADQGVVNECNFTSEQLAKACRPLCKVTAKQIAEVLAVPPDE